MERIIVVRTYSDAAVACILDALTDADILAVAYEYVEGTPQHAAIDRVQDLPNLEDAQ